MYSFLRISMLATNNIRNIYKNNQEIKSLSYLEQIKKISESFSMWPGDYSYYLNKLNYETNDIMFNVENLQKQWAKEHNSNKTGIDLLIEQIKFYKPNILFLQHTSAFENNIDIIDNLRRDIKGLKIIVAFRCAPLTKASNDVLSKVDLVLTCSPHTLQMYRDMNFKTDLLFHAFDERILNKIKHKEKINKITFAGGLYEETGYHSSRANLLKDLIKNDIAIDIFSTHNDHELSKYLKSPKYGFEYFNTISKYTININAHIDMAENYAANMRMFEVAGVGSCLLTDYKKNLASFFDIDNEVITYSNRDEAIEKSNWLLNNPKQAKEIALKGQQRVLNQHTYKHRAEQLDQIFRYHISQI